MDMVLCKYSEDVEIIHHFGLKMRSVADARTFANLGIQLELRSEGLPGFGVTGFEISESDPRWFEARRLAQEFQITEFVRTKFSEHEKRSANVLCMLASLQKGYPSDASYFDFLAETYDLGSYCLHCGAGLLQVRPLRIKSAKNLNRSVSQPNWIFDEFLVARDLWMSVFKPFGIDCWPVLSARTGAEIDSVVQLRIVHEAHLDHEDTATIACAHCGRKKSPLDLRGFAPLPTTAPAHMFKSVDLFGSDANAFHRVFVSREMFREIRRKGLRGLDFYPCNPG